MNVLIRIVDRLLPIAVMIASVSLLTAGVLSYAPYAFGDWQTPVPTLVGGDPRLDSPAPGSTAEATDGGGQTGEPTPVSSGASDTPGATPEPTETFAPQTPEPDPTPTLGPGDTPRPTRAPTDPPTTPGPTDPRNTSPPATPKPTDPAGTPGPTPRPTPRPTATPGPTPAPGGHAPATRVRIPSLDIDLPVVPSDLVVPGNKDFYPLCDVAMYMVGFVNPGQNGTTYIYGHAQDGMFAPLLHASKYNNGASLIGALVQVYTNDSKLHLYEITVVKRHATDLSITRIPPGTHQLVLQTSEGWSGHPQKLQVAARPIAVVDAGYNASHPAPHPRVCLPG